MLDKVWMMQLKSYQSYLKHCKKISRTWKLLASVTTEKQ